MAEQQRASLGGTGYPDTEQFETVHGTWAGNESLEGSDMEADSTATLSLTRPFSQGLVLLLNFGMWDLWPSPIVPHGIVSIRYDLGVAVWGIGIGSGIIFG
jgi:hypothetical protein